MAFMKALFGTGEAREATKKGARAYDELAARRKACYATVQLVLHTV